MDTKCLGQRIKQARKMKKMSAGSLSELVGIGEYHLREIERGVACPSLNVLVDISNVLSQRMEFFLQDYLQFTSQPSEVSHAALSLSKYPREKLLFLLDLMNGLELHHSFEEKLEKLKINDS